MQGVIDLALSDQNHDFPAGFVFFHAAMRGDDPVEGETCPIWTRITTSQPSCWSL